MARKQQSAGAGLLDRPLPTSQQRSRDTSEQLLRAAEDLLREGGADAATLRSIADRAGVSLGIVYRRFRDKDAVLRAVYTRFFEQVAAANARSLESGTERLERATIAQVSATLVKGIAEGYRAQRQLLRALILYVRTHPDADFRKRAAALNAGAYEGVQRLFEPQTRGVPTPRRQQAVGYAISAAAALLQERIVFPDATVRPELSYAELVEETTAMITAYLTNRLGS